MRSCNTARYIYSVCIVEAVLSERQGFLNSIDHLYKSALLVELKTVGIVPMLVYYTTTPPHAFSSPFQLAEFEALLFSGFRPAESRQRSVQMAQPSVFFVASDDPTDRG